MDCETCHLNVTIPAYGDGDDVTVCPECGRNVCPGPILAPPRVIDQAPVDGVTPLASFDRKAYDELEATLRDGLVREYPPPWAPKRTLTADDRRGLLDQLPGLVPLRRCGCGDEVCLSYDFASRAEIDRGSVITFDVAGIAILEIDKNDRILAFECILDTRKMSYSLVYPEERAGA